jgi:dipeptidyl aminopeptidase/acylaminoacyl peptidase
MWGFQSGPPDGLYFLGDERNDERINLFRLDPASGSVRALTDEPYTYGASSSPDRSRWAVLPRRGDGPYETCLETMAADGSDRQQVLCDTPEAPLTWGSPSWAPDRSGVLVNVDIGGRRDRANVAWVPFDDPRLQIVTEPIGERTTAWALGRWLSRTEAILVTTEDGVPTLSVVDVATGGRRVLASFEGSIDDARLLDDGRLLVQLDRTDGDALVLIDPSSGAQLAELALEGSASLRGEPDGVRLLMEVTRAAAPRTLVVVTAGPDGLTVQPWLAPPTEIASRLVQCDVERVTFPTHDLDPATGAQRQLDALLYTPKRGVQPPLARILAFYGGADRFDTETQVFCEAGITTLSPAVRGSRGRGEAFARLNDGDLGGDEIADLFAAATFLEERGVSQERIGVYGRSHGGYATMRALTFPAGTNGHEQPYPFAFGISDAGFSDIVSFYETCNIPDWVILEAGDPATEADALNDRSPLHHVDLLSAPLLLVHGAEDSRVPVQQSRQLALACDAAGKTCRYLEVPGQGHRVSGVANEVQVYAAKLDFLAEFF